MKKINFYNQKQKIILLIVIGMILLNLNFIVSQSSFCCEKAENGALCMNVDDESKCNDEFKIAPTHCSSTAYCKLGCCYDTEEGICMENTPESACEQGKWFSSKDCDISACNSGCCLMGDQASFVTKQRCKALSGLYGLETNFRSDISNELSCIATVESDREGACVYEQEYQLECERTSREECDEKEQDTEFYEGLLCTAPELDTICEPTQETTCVPEKDEVYYLDNCGNIANVYDYSKKDDNSYWTYIVEQKNDMSVCELNSDLSNSDTCGNCDYYDGSVCKEYEKFENSKKPKLGDYICKDLSCEYKGERFEHGESWCGFTNPSGDEYKLDEVSNTDLIGGRYYRLICYNGDVTLEPCADYRQEICTETTIGDSEFKNSMCIANKWQNCYAQDNKEDCENTDQRNCNWINEESDEVKTDEEGEPATISCVPENTPGIDFWGSSNAEENTEGSSEAEGVCSVANTQIVVECEEDLGGDKECDHDSVVNDDGDVKQSWKELMNNKCIQLGDCGIKDNYALSEGYVNDLDKSIQTSKKDLG
ncbi:MAG: hypothetical protein ACOC1K_05500 [Nanoarchaeota archaeon]